MVSLKDARVMVEEGGCTIWGQLPDIPYKSNKFGMGFTSQAQKAVCRARAGRPPFRININEFNAMEDINSDGDFNNWIFPTIDNRINNWKAKDFVSISFSQE